MQPNTLRLDVWSPKNLQNKIGESKIKTELHKMTKRGVTEKIMNFKLEPQVSVPLSTAVTEVGVTLHTGHVVASLCALNMDLRT